MVQRSTQQNACGYGAGQRRPARITADLRGNQIAAVQKMETDQTDASVVVPTLVCTRFSSPESSRAGRYRSDLPLYCERKCPAQPSNPRGWPLPRAQGWVAAGSRCAVRSRHSPPLLFTASQDAATSPSHARLPYHPARPYNSGVSNPTTPTAKTRATSPHHHAREAPCMAATACAYGYQATVPPQVLLPADTFSDVKQAETAPAPPPRPSSKVPPSFLSHHLDICTEGLGSESSGDIDLSDLTDDVNKDDDNAVGHEVVPCKWQHRDGEPGRARSARPSFPPPISLIGAGGKPWLYLRPQREDGRLVLREVRIPSRELLQARREDGRFKLQFAQPQPDEEDECQLAQGKDPADAMAPEKSQQGNEED